MRKQTPEAAAKLIEEMKKAPPPVTARAKVQALNQGNVKKKPNK